MTRHSDWRAEAWAIEQWFAFEPRDQWDNFYNWFCNTDDGDAA